MTSASTQQLAAEAMEREQAAQPDAERQQDREVPAPSHSETPRAVQSIGAYCGTVKPCRRRMARGSLAANVVDRIVSRPDRRCLSSTIRWRSGGWSSSGIEGVGAAVGEPRRQHERIREQAADGVAGRGKLRRLRNRVAEDEVRPHGVQQSALAQHGFGSAAIGRDLGIGDREAADAAVLHHAREPVEPAVDRERRARAARTAPGGRPRTPHRRPA